MSLIRWATQALIGAAILVLLAWEIAGGTHGSAVLAAVLGVAVLGMATVRLEYACASLLFVAPFYFVAKAMFPAPFDMLWWDLSIVLIFIGWLLRSRRVKRAGPVVWLTVAFIAWGVIEVVRGPSLLPALLAFRRLFLPLLLIGPIADTVVDRHTSRLYVGAVLTAGILTSILSLLTFALLNGHLIAPGSFLDSGRAIYMAAHQGYAPSLRYNLIRSMGPFPDPGQTAIYLAGVLGILVAVAFRSGSGRGLARWGVVLTFLALISTLSTWPIMVGVFGAGAGFVVARGAGRRIERMLMVAALLGLIVLSWRIGGDVALPSDPLLAKAQSYSLSATADHLANLGDAVVHLDLLGGGLYAVSGTAMASGATPHPLGLGYFFLDDLAAQTGLIGVTLLLMLWVTSLARSYRSTNVSETQTDLPLAAIAWTGLIILLLGSMHYGAPLIYGPNVLLILLFGLADADFGSDRRYADAGPPERSRTPILNQT